MIIMEWNIIVGAVCAILGAIFGYMGFSRNKAVDNRNEGKHDGMIMTELGYIKANTDEIKAEQKDQRKINTEVLSRLTNVESRAEQAHFRLDHLEHLEHQDK